LLELLKATPNIIQEDQILKSLERIIKVAENQFGVFFHPVLPILFRELLFQSF
jgi:hypothetical protein